jgi:general secretion pathway protein L
MKTGSINSHFSTFFCATAESIKRMGRGLWRIGAFSLADEHIAPGQCLSVSLDLGGISVAYGTRVLSRIKIIGARHYPFEEGRYPAPEEFASAVYLAANDLGAMKADVTLIIPRAWTIMKTADFPLVVKENLGDVVSCELDRLTPLSADQAYYDYQVTGEDSDRLTLMVAALKAETLTPYLDALAQKGMRVAKVIDSISALGALSRHISSGAAAAFLEIRPQGYEGGMIDGGRLVDSFRESFPSLMEPDQALNVATEINPRIDALKQAGKAPSVFVNTLMGAWPLLPDYIHAPVRFFNETDLKLPWRQREGFVSYNALGGVLMSLRSGLSGMNLLDKGIHKTRKVPLGLTLLLLLSLVALGIFSLMASVQIAERKVEAIDREIAARKNQIRQIEALQKETVALQQEITAIEQFKTTRPMVLNLIKELTAVLPKNTWLLRVRVTDTGVEIDGYTASATGMLTKLEASHYFRKVEFSSPTYRDPRTGAYHFAIKMEKEGQTEEKGKNAEKE